MPPTALRSVLAASDLGPRSDTVVRSAAVLAERAGAELHLMHAYELSVLPERDPAGLPPSFPERIQQAERALAEQARRVAGAVEPASLRVMNFAPHEAILAHATDVAADLVVLGPHRGGDLGARILGTTAERVIRDAAVPCLIATAPLSLPVRRIGVPTDFSAAAGAALDAALALAPVLDDAGVAPELRVIHVQWAVERGDEPGTGEEDVRPRLEAKIRQALARAESPPGGEVRAEVLWNVSPPEAIARYAREAELDLLVLGTHGRRGLERVLIGSVAAGLVRDAPCPVLLVGAPRARG